MLVPRGGSGGEQGGGGGATGGPSVEPGAYCAQGSSWHKFCTRAYPSGIVLHCRPSCDLLLHFYELHVCFTPITPVHLCVLCIVADANEKGYAVSVLW